MMKSTVMNSRICICHIYIYKLYICVGYIRVVYDSVKKPPENQLCSFNNLSFFLLSEPHLCRPTWPYVAPSTRLATPCMSKPNPHLQAEEWNSWGHPASAWSPVQQQFLGHGGGQTIMGMKVMSGKDIFDNLASGLVSRCWQCATLRGLHFCWVLCMTDDVWITQCNSYVFMCGAAKCKKCVIVLACRYRRRKKYKRKS